MRASDNPLKDALRTGQKTIGCWLGFADGYCAEIMGQTGFDWLVIDGEHAPNDIRSIRDQLMALEHSASQAIVRLPSDETWLIKQALDVGARSLLIPMVETAEQAERIVAATRYPPEGIRGMGATLARASKFGTLPNYVHDANAGIAVIVQVETVKGMEHLDAIASVDGVDGVFIGPADLSADMGFPGQASAPEVVAAMEDAAKRIKAAGKSPGSLALDEAAQKIYLEFGYEFLAVGIDVVMLVRAAQALARRWKHEE